MARRINKEIVKAIKDYILADVDKEDTVSELRRYKKDFWKESDYNWYRYGNILPYYSQIRDFYAEHGVEASEDNEVLCSSFCKCVGKAIDLILEENEGK